MSRTGLILFWPGRIVTTPGALEAFRASEESPLDFLMRHLTGDWGDLSAVDKLENKLSVEMGFRILSAYTLKTGVKVWLITEADRSVTTFLLPEEY
jgi:hypothetical protein